VAVDTKQKARKALRRARANYERDAEAAKEARRKALAEAQAAGLSLREIADEVGLHYSRISEILNGK
jgi:transcriptional regulator with XRE-family HTH domain